MSKHLSALAVAALITGGMSAAHAGDLSHVNTTLAAVTGTNGLVLATEIFGAGSEETLIKIPVTNYEIHNASGTPAADAFVDRNVSTIKYTLGGDAVFGEPVTTTTITNFGWLSATVSTGALKPIGDGTLVAGDVSYEVVQGGAIGDNTVTIQFTDVGWTAGSPPVAAADLQDIVFGGWTVKNLKGALQKSGPKQVDLGVEYYAGTDAIGTTGTDTDTPLTVFRSQDALKLVVTGIPMPRINVATSEKLLTGTTGSAADADFDVGTSVATVDFGTIQLQRTVVAPTTVKVKKENGDAFDFQGGDKHTLVLRAEVGDFNAFKGSTNKLYLTTGVCGAAATSPLTSGYNTGVISTDGKTATFALVGNTVALETQHNICGVVDTTTQIAETTLCANWAVDFFNSRYVDVNNLDGCVNPLLRNGCRVTLFNVPASTNATDAAFIRLTNTSATDVTGAVRATVWAQDGTKLVENQELLASLKPHATAVFTSLEGAAAPANTTSLESTLGLDPTKYAGRARVVLVGAFPGCEAQGLIRTGGQLFNMTSTTNANSNDNIDSVGNADTTGHRRGNTGR